MKKFILSCCVLGLYLSSTAQNDYIKNPALGLHFFFNDFQTAADIRANRLVAVINDKEWTKAKRMSPGLAISYLEGLSNHLDFAGTLSASFVKYTVEGKKISSDNLLLELAATANLKLLTDNYVVSPFLTLGAGASKYKGYYGAFIPAGVGIQVNAFDGTFILLNSQYRIPVTTNVNHHFYYSIGVAGNIGEKKVKKPVVLPPPPVVVQVPKDTDGDGIADADDKCPDIAGIASLQGCPDKDGDGIADASDKCPAVAGLSKYEGCPIPDTDNDGINDEADKCPAVAGVARYEGCPVPDTDGDGINDEEDKCPSKAGTATNFGCPEIAKAVVDKINYAAGNIFFASGSTKLLQKSYKSLNEVVKILTADPSLKLNIEGHTDNTGKPEKNQTLSDLRAAAVKAYLVGKGIDQSRLTSKGFGQDQPIADNKTAAGKAKNRRVELKATNY